jgi:hypothetical protein
VVSEYIAEPAGDENIGNAFVVAQAKPRLKALNEPEVYRVKFLRRLSRAGRRRREHDDTSARRPHAREDTEPRRSSVAPGAVVPVRKNCQSMSRHVLPTCAFATS